MCALPLLCPYGYGDINEAGYYIPYYSTGCVLGMKLTMHASG